jgi:hypothetical protein
MKTPSMEELLNAQIEITAPARGVEVQFKEDGKVLWVNVDGICVLRICQIPVLIVRHPDISGGLVLANSVGDKFRFPDLNVGL